jgi:ABC-2 type transport system permease protein
MIAATGVRAPARHRGPAGTGGPAARLTQTLADGMVVTKRNLIKIKRIPDLLLFTTIQPIMFVLLFAYVFGGAIDVRGGNYREFLMAGIFVQTVAFGSSLTAVGLADDLQKGIIDRFRSLPMARSAVLVGRTTSDLLNNVIVVVVMSLCGLFVGWRIRDGVLDALAAYALLLLFAYALSWVSAVIGLAVRTVEVAQSAGFIWLFPVTFASNAFVPPETMPSWLQPLAEWNPVSVTVAGCRDLFGNPSPFADATSLPARHPVALSLAFSLTVLAVFVPLAVRRYRAAASR